MDEDAEEEEDEEEEEAGEAEGRRSGRQEERKAGGAEGRSGRQEERKAADIKSNNPHLAGGEKHLDLAHFPLEHGCYVKILPYFWTHSSVMVILPLHWRWESEKKVAISLTRPGKRLQLAIENCHL